MSKKIVAKKAFSKSLPVMAAYITLGMGFGFLMADKGYSPIWSVFCSVFIFAGAMQYLAADLLAAAVSPAYAAVMTLAVNARHFFYGISMIEKYKPFKKLKPYMIFGLTDETYSILCSAEDYPENKKDAELYCFLITLFNHLYWITGSALGALIGSLSAFNSNGIDFSMTALFVTVFIDQWRTGKERRCALLGIAAAVLCLIVFGKNIFLIPAMTAVTVLICLAYRLKGAKNE